MTAATSLAAGIGRLERWLERRHRRSDLVGLVLDGPADDPGLLRVGGVRRYGDLERDRQPVHRRVADALQAAGCARRERVADLPPDLRPGEHVLLAPAWLLPRPDGDFAAKLRRIARAEQPAALAGGDDAAVLYLPADLAGRYLAGPPGPPLARLRALGVTDPIIVPIGDAAIDLRREHALADFVAGGSAARHFNRLEQEGQGRYLRKRSRDKGKMRREHDCWHLLPGPMRTWMVMPFDFRDEGGTASYRMERLPYPDLASQWVSHPFDPAETELLLDRIFAFMAERPTRSVPRAEALAAADALYRDKLAARLEQLAAMPVHDALAAQLQNHPRYPGLPAMRDAWLALYERHRARLVLDRLAIGHGDPCFSNILYDRRTGFLKLIDPRGAVTEAELWTDPTYDLAKLSHSVQGGYDHVNSHRFTVELGNDLAPVLALEREPGPELRAAFERRLEALGFSPRLVRLGEASLFLSMLPLHADWPRKILGYALIAARILAELEDTETAA